MRRTEIRMEKMEEMGRLGRKGRIGRKDREDRKNREDKKNREDREDKGWEKVAIYFTLLLFSSTTMKCC